MLRLFKTNFLLKGLVILFLSICSYSVFAAEQSLDRIVAVVNDSVITETELNHAISILKQQLLGNQVAVPAPAMLRKQALDQLINRKLQLQLAETAKVKVSTKEINSTIEKIAKQNHLTVNQLYEKVAAQGLSQEDYKKEIQDEIIIQQIQQQAVNSKVVITPQEVDDFIRSPAWLAYSTKEYHLEDILVVLPEKPSSSAVQEAKKTADTILAKIRTGKNFRAVATEESVSNKALQGGDLGWRKLPEVPSAFAEKLIHMKAGEILGPIQTPNGFHIIHLAGIRDSAGKTTKAMEHKQVQQLIYQRKFEEALQNWTTKLRSEAFINTHPEN